MPIDTRTDVERFEEAVEACRNPDAELFFQNLHRKIGSIYDAMKTLIESIEGQNGDKWEAGMIELRQLENLKVMLLRTLVDNTPPSLRFTKDICPAYVKDYVKNRIFFPNILKSRSEPNKFPLNTLLKGVPNPELIDNYIIKKNAIIQDILLPKFTVTIETLKHNLQIIRECMLDLNNQPRTDDELNNNGVYLLNHNVESCPYFGNSSDSVTGCKNYSYMDIKKNIMNILKTLIESAVRELAERNPDAIRDSNTYVIDLYKTLEFYMFFIGGKHLDPIGIFVKPLVDTLNQIIFPITGFKLIEIQNYNPENYNSCRSVGILPPLPDKQYPDKDRIIFVNQEGSPNQSKIASDGMIGGGKSRRRTRRRNTRKRK